ncbi:MAG: glycosyl hydrolase [Ignavibacteriae bacterium]|nr:MAG: glycosyl hydrolase [Ignavibacteriota bacterium]
MMSRIMGNPRANRIQTMLAMIVMLFCTQNILAGDLESYVSSNEGNGKFTLSASGHSAPLCVSSQDYPGVIRVLKQLQTDIEKVTAVKPAMSLDVIPNINEVVLVGTLGRSPLIDKLVRAKKLNVKQIAGKWEAYLIQVIEKPFPHIDRALIIAGSDKRGTIYGLYDLSKQIGVSPWYWWADVPVDHKESLFVNPGPNIQGSPSVKYRGLFLNDEYPDLTNWVNEKFGTVPLRDNPPTHEGIANYNHQFYEKIFELILRLKGNYLWPAMWNNAFNEDDPENPRLADEYGIVMGTSHQEPMLRAQKEWDRRYLRTLGSWNYARHPDLLQNFWREGIRRNKNYESIITIGLRGADDTPMAPGGPEENMALLEKIVNVQRNILAEEMNPKVTAIPQLWCLYKEVQAFYNAGMRVPDDVTLLWAEDNWGNIRRLPTADERKRSGGAGIYYHFDYHGGPRSYQWINSNPIAKIWDQMSLAKQYGADRIWIVNVGHFKGYELPLEYFMDLAWNTNQWTNDNTIEYTRRWAEREFGSASAADIADILSKYTKYNGRRKPELLGPETYSLINYREAENVVMDYNAISAKAEELFSKMPEAKRDAYYELVLFPTKASAMVNELYLAAGKNILYARQGRASTNDMANKVRDLFQRDTSLMGYYNRTFAGGKWNHFMDQTHLGYTNWQDPPTNSLRAIKLSEISLRDTALMGVAVDGSEECWPGSATGAVLPPFDVFNQQHHYVDVFNKGTRAFEYTVAVSDSWIVPSEFKGTVNKDNRLWFTIDWNKIRHGMNTGKIKIIGTNSEVEVNVNAFNPTEISRDSLLGFVEGEGTVSIEAEHYTKKTDAGSRQWMKIEDYGHTLSAMRATAPADAKSAVPGKDAPCLEYQMYLFTSDTVEVRTIHSPTLNFMPNRSLQFAVSMDNEVPQILTLVPAGYSAQNGNRDWEKSVVNNARLSRSTHTIAKSGYHTLKIWMVDPGVVLQKIVVNTGGVKPCSLGPPESFHIIPKPEKRNK